MGRSAVAVVAFALVLALPLAAKADQEVGGVTFPATVEAAGEKLQFNGAAVRSRFVVSVYAIGLYLAKPTQTAQEAITSEQPKQIRMHMLRDLGRSTVGDAIREGFQKNASAQMEKLGERLEKLVTAIPDLKKGDRLTLSYLPGRGTQLTTAQGETITIPGKDFADALFAVWLGSQPVDAKVKKGLLGAR